MQDLQTIADLRVRIGSNNGLELVMQKVRYDGVATGVTFQVVRRNDVPDGVPAKRRIVRQVAERQFRDPIARVCRILCKRTIHRRRKPACP